MQVSIRMILAYTTLWAILSCLLRSNLVPMQLLPSIALLHIFLVPAWLRHEIECPFYLKFRFHFFGALLILLSYPFSRVAPRHAFNNYHLVILLAVCQVVAVLELVKFIQSDGPNLMLRTGQIYAIWITLLLPYSVFYLG